MGVTAMATDPLPPRQPGPLRRAAGGVIQRSSGLTAAAVVAVALVIGMQLGGVPWRYRRQIWQLQGAALGALVGFVVGRISASSVGDRKD